MYLTLLQRIRHRLLSLRSKRSIAAGVRPSIFGVLGGFAGDQDQLGRVHGRRRDAMIHDGWQDMD